MNEIQFMEKPEWVSWEDICECIRKADVVNDKKGFHMMFSDMKPDVLKEKLQGGKCFVALHNNRVVGMDSFQIHNRKKWYKWGKVIFHSFSAVLPEYRGTDVYFGLCELKEKKVKETGIRVYQFSTAEQNKTVLKINAKYGFKQVVYRPTPVRGAKYYSIVMLKWEDGCPFPDWFLNFMFKLSRFVTRTFFTTDNNFKFWHK